MQAQNTENISNIGAMKKRRVVMADGRRYLIYYSFENSRNSSAPTIEITQAKPKNEIVEETEASENV